jgi:hypothetical protein
MAKKQEHPMQPLVMDGKVVRFKANKIVQYLLDNNGRINLNLLATIPFPADDREQFAQLIGYSVSGFGELSYVRDKTYEKAANEAGKLLSKKKGSK